MSPSAFQAPSNSPAGENRSNSPDGAFQGSFGRSMWFQVVSIALKSRPEACGVPGSFSDSDGEIKRIRSRS